MMSLVTGLFAVSYAFDSKSLLISPSTQDVTSTTFRGLDTETSPALEGNHKLTDVFNLQPGLLGPPGGSTDLLPPEEHHVQNRAAMSGMELTSKEAALETSKQQSAVQ